MLELIQEKGSGSWLTTLPIKSLGYSLNKQEFRDSICLRYGWNIPNTPNYSQCRKENGIDHTLNCKLGGGIITLYRDEGLQVQGSMMLGPSYK